MTYGFPAGGEQISYTRGVVSRIEVEGYVHIGNRAFLAVQTDAAINPGNSGGPVIQDDKVVGVAFEGTARPAKHRLLHPHASSSITSSTTSRTAPTTACPRRACDWPRCKTRPSAAC